MPLLFFFFSFFGFIFVPLHFFPHSASLCLFPWSRRCRFQHGPCAGLVLRRPAGLASCGALSGIAALCLACVSVVVIVISYVLVRIFYLGSWGGPRSFRESAELQTPMDFTTFPALLFHCHSRRRL